jgi:hypothetical protein
MYRGLGNHPKVPFEKDGSVRTLLANNQNLSTLLGNMGNLKLSGMEHDAVKKGAIIISNFSISRA